MARKKIFWLNCLVIVVVAFNLRAPITSVGVIIEVIKEYYSLSSAMAGLLISLPLIAFGSVSFIAPYFAPIVTLMWGILFIIFGEILRSINGEIGLFVGMSLLGAGIAIGNVLLPSFVKQKFPDKLPQMMGLYSLTLNLSAVVGIAISFPLLYFLPLRLALSFWAIFALLALLIYIPQIRNGRIFRAKQKLVSAPNVFRHKSAWIITCFMGVQGFIAYSIFSWFASMVIYSGYSQEVGGQVLLVSQLVAVPVGLFGPLLLARLRNIYKAPYIAILCLCYIVAFFLLLIFDSLFVFYISSILIGIPMGGVFGIVLLFMSTKSQNVFIAARLSAMSQGLGYLIASSAPLILGCLNDYFGGFKEAIILLIFVSFIVCILGLLAYKSPIITMRS